jgi:hypothetical protein
MKSFYNPHENAAISDALPVDGRRTAETVAHRSRGRELVAAGSALVIALSTGVAFAQPRVEGSVGAAKRYRAPALSERDMVLGDAALQNLLQSDTLDKILRDESVQVVTSDRDVRRRLARADLRSLEADPTLARALADPATRAALADVEFWQALEAMEEQDEDRFRAGEPGATGYVFKPLDKMTPKLAEGSEFSVGYVFKPLDKMTPKVRGGLTGANFWQALKAGEEKKKGEPFSAGGASVDLTTGFRMLTSARESVEKARNIASGLK